MSLPDCTTGASRKLSRVYLPFFVEDTVANSVKPTGDSENRATATLRTWAELGRRLTNLPEPVVVRWDASSRMIRAATPYFKVAAEKLIGLLDESNKLLKPLTDPLQTDFGVHRWLKGDREEAYSDWLAWIVQNLDATAVLDVFALKRLFSDKPLPNVSINDRPEVKREACVPKGHANKQGRLDLLIRLQPDALLVVETKLGNADQADTAKQEGYAQWLPGPGCDAYRILLARDGDQELYEGDFRLLKWHELCLCLRRLCTQLIATGQITLAAMTLAFVGAVEQNLLGLSVAAANAFHRSRASTFDERVVEHLQKWVDTGASP